MSTIYIQNTINMNTKAMAKAIKASLEYFEMDDEDRDCFHWLFVETNDIKTKNDLFLKVRDSFRVWTQILVYFEALEEYEMCAKIRDIIENEKLDFQTIIKNYFKPNKADKQRIERILQKEREEAYNRINK